MVPTTVVLMLVGSTTESDEGDTTMVEGQSMTTVADVVAEVRDGRLEDFVREAVVLIARELMEGEISVEVGAELGEVAPDSRVTYRNGYRPRAWETRVGEIELLVPRKRSGPAYFPSFLEARRPAEQAIVAVVMEATSTASVPARSTGWSSSSGSRG